MGMVAGLEPQGQALGSVTVWGNSRSLCSHQPAPSAKAQQELCSKGTGPRSPEPFPPAVLEEAPLPLPAKPAFSCCSKENKVLPCLHSWSSTASAGLCLTEMGPHDAT